MLTIAGAMLMARGHQTVVLDGILQHGSTQVLLWDSPDEHLDGPATILLAWV